MVDELAQGTAFIPGDPPPEDQMVNRWIVPVTVPLAGTTTTLGVTFPANTSHTSRLANLYFTVNSALSEIVQWTSRLDSHFRHTSGAANGIFRVVYGPDWTGGGGNFMAGWGILLQYDIVQPGLTRQTRTGTRGQGGTARSQVRIQGRT